LTKQQAGDGVFGRAQRKAAAGGKIELTRVAVNFGDDGGKASGTQPLLKHPQGVDGARHTHHDEACRIDAEMAEPSPIEEAAFDGGGLFDDPQHGAAGISRQPHEKGGGEAGHGGGIATLGGAQFVQSGALQAASQQGVQARNGEGQ